MVEFIPLEQEVLQKVYNGLLVFLGVELRIFHRQGSYLASKNTSGGSKMHVYFSNQAEEAKRFQVVHKHGQSCIRCCENAGAARVLVFNQAESPYFFLRKKLLQGDVVLNLWEGPKETWLLGNATQTLFVSRKKDEVFVLTAEREHGETFFLEMYEPSLVSKLEQVVSVSSRFPKELQQSALSVNAHNSSQEYCLLKRAALDAILFCGITVQLVSYHRSLLRVNWSKQPLQVSTTREMKDNSTEFFVMSRDAFVTISQGEYFLNFSNSKEPVLQEEPHLIGFEWVNHSGTISLFDSQVFGEKYLCVTKKGNVEFHRRRKEWETFRILARKQELEDILSVWKSFSPNDASASREHNRANETKTTSTTGKKFDYKKALASVADHENTKEPNISTENQIQIEHGVNGSSAKIHEPKPRKKKNRRRKKGGKNNMSGSKDTVLKMSSSGGDSVHEGNNKTPLLSSVSDHESNHATREKSQVKEENDAVEFADWNESDRNTSFASLQSQESQGSMARSAPSGKYCAACQQPLTSSYVTALGKLFHSECFRCFRCSKVLVTSGDGRFRHDNGKPYCHNCYASWVAPRCAKCLQPILETVTKAMKQNWHPQCLICTQCNTPLSTTFYLFLNYLESQSVLVVQ
eukprot:jgi/Galph1/4113/GphlegSOOS_G2775.1